MTVASLAMRGISDAACQVSRSITHGTRADVERINKNLSENERVIDLSIGTLDLSTDQYIDNNLIDSIKHKSDSVHAFTPVKGLPFLREAIAGRMHRLRQDHYDPETDILVTPGGIKGAITVTFQCLINPGDEVLIPIPNWPHYADMVKLHSGVPVFLKSPGFPQSGLCPEVLDESITPATKIIILGDCINPIGKVYQDSELKAFAKIITKHNEQRKKEGMAPVYVLFDCPYEAHILSNRPISFASLLREYTIFVTGPGKTYGMHGDRIGYMCAPSSFIEVAENVQANLNSFASNYGQIATYYALQEPMDSVAEMRARSARENLMAMIKSLKELDRLNVNVPEGGYFIFVDFSAYSTLMNKLGYQRADQFLLNEARVATICGAYFAKGYNLAESLNYHVRMNCGRSDQVLHEAASRIIKSLSKCADSK